jgi:hypothetical protein
MKNMIVTIAHTLELTVPRAWPTGPRAIRSPGIPVFFADTNFAVHSATTIARSVPHLYVTQFVAPLPDMPHNTSTTRMAVWQDLPVEIIAGIAQLLKNPRSLW